MNCRGIELYLVILQLLYVLVQGKFHVQNAKRKDTPPVAKQKWFPEQQMCPGQNDKVLAETDIPFGVPGRAYLTVPPEIDIYRSTIPKAGLGAMATTFIPKHTWLGEYQGITVLPSEEEHISWYAWTVYRGDAVLRYIDAGELETSNWARFLNMPNNVYDENVVVRECFDRIYYQTSKDIYPGQELLVDYGDIYAKSLGLFEELELSDALRTAEQLAGDDKEMNEVVTELKQLMGLAGDSVTQGLRTLLSDNNSAISRTMGQKLRNSINKDDLKSGGNR